MKIQIKKLKNQHFLPELQAHCQLTYLFISRWLQTDVVSVAKKIHMGLLFDEKQRNRGEMV